jgi:hypothetical protein
MSFILLSSVTSMLHDGKGGAIVQAISCRLPIAADRFLNQATHMEFLVHEVAQG